MFTGRLIAGALVCASLLLPALAGAATDGQWVIVDQGGAAQTLMTLNPITATEIRGEHVLYTAAAGHRLDAPQWSPDGNRIVFVDSGRVLVYELASGAITQLAEGTAPSWAPGGARIAFLRDGRLLTRLVDGSDEQPLPVDATGVRDVAWSPDGAWLALWVGDGIDLASVDGAVRETVGEDAVGGAAWAPDSRSFVYSRDLPVYGDSELERVWLDSGARSLVPLAHGPPATDLEPDFSPSGLALAFIKRTPAPSLDVALPAALETGGLNSAIVPSQPDWQPCVAGVTAQCTSVTPIPPPAPPTCPPMTVTAMAQRWVTIQFTCTGALRYEIVDPPAHGQLMQSAAPQYQAAPGFAGDDSFSYRATGARGASTVARVDIRVVARPARPAAPRLSVTGRPRLDRTGHLVLRGTCDRACTVTLRVRLTLNTGRTVQGRAVSASAPAGGALKLRLARGRIPARRRVVKARVIGRLAGADGLTRSFTLSVK